eukprot:COSAG01_NODE_65453_length_273_cov_0.597701_2_plen_44_part_01
MTCWPCVCSLKKFLQTVGFQPGGPVAECKFYNHPGNKGCRYGGS